MTRHRSLSYRINSLLLRGAASCALLATGCGGDEEDPGLPANAQEAVATYSRIVLASYEDSLSSAQELQAAIEALVENPSAANQDAAQDAWRAARVPYLQTEVYRFYGGPIDDADGPEGLINAWPLDESHIDYVMGDPDAGIINDPEREITPAALEAANETPSEDSISTGYHAIEFLLWGQDMNPTGPGQRPFTDYAVTGGTAANQDRRGQYLTTAGEMLIGHLEDLVEAWGTGTRTYRATLESEPPAQALSKIMSGMTILSGFETGQERLTPALDNNDQEEEHSCFSDNTHVDMIEDIRGVQNVWLGRYEPLEGATISGTGVQAVIAAADANLADRITDQIEESLELAEALVPPFDREIAEDNPAGNARVEALIQALYDQRDLLDEAFELYELNRIQDPGP